MKEEEGSGRRAQSSGQRAQGSGRRAESKLSFSET